MAKIMEIVEKETKGKSYHTYKYSFVVLRCNLMTSLVLHAKICLMPQICHKL